MGLNAVLSGKHTLHRRKNLQRPSVPVAHTDIAYISMEREYLYLLAVIDLHGRYVLNWSVPKAMDAQWCGKTLEEAIGGHRTPLRIVNYVFEQGIHLGTGRKGNG